MYFVPEGQHDSSQARSAWSHEDNSLVPAGRLNGSRLVMETSHKHVLVSEIQKKVNHGQHLLLCSPGTDNDFDRPSGTRALSASIPRHFVPGYYQPVPPGQKPLTHRAPRIELALVGYSPGLDRERSGGNPGRHGVPSWIPQPIKFIKSMEGAIDQPKTVRPPIHPAFFGMKELRSCSLQDELFDRFGKPFFVHSSSDVSG